MPLEVLEFEEPIAAELRELEALLLQPPSAKRDRLVSTLKDRLNASRRKIYAGLTPWQRVVVARHPDRPSLLDYADRLFTNFVEVHGDRRFGDDHAMIVGVATHRGREVMIVGHQKGRDTKQKIYRNFGYARPEGYRKALRAMRLAEKFHRPVVVFVDTPAAFPGIESEERGVAEAIALNLREMSMLDVPIVVLITGEGGSGGALGIAVGDRILMQEFAIYSVIPPEGCAAILWRDAKRKIEAAESLRLTAPDLLRLGIVDRSVAEPPGGAHTDHASAAARLDADLTRALDELTAVPSAERLEQRYRKFRRMGEVNVAFSEGAAPVALPSPDATRGLGTSGV